MPGIEDSESAARPTGVAGERFTCPFCGEPAATHLVCDACGARTDPLSRQATQNEMGPWFVRDAEHPHRPGCRLETIERWVRAGTLSADSIIRGPSTSQNWSPARRVPGVARLFGRCHACEESVEADEMSCRGCGAHLHAERDRQHLGLSPIRELPGRGDPGAIAERLLIHEPKLRVGPMMTNTGPNAGPNTRPDSGPDSGGVHGGVAATAGAIAGRGEDLPQLITRPASDLPRQRTSREAELERRLAAANRRGLITIGLAAGLLAAAGVLGYALRTQPAAEPFRTAPAVDTRDDSATSGDDAENRTD